MPAPLPAAAAPGDAAPRQGAGLVLRAEGLRKAYRGTPVVNDVSLRVHTGETVGLLGPNGAGKTTCFYMMVGLVRADAGRIVLGERDITGLPMHERARLGIGYLPQEASVFRRMSVQDNILAVLETRRGMDRHERQRRAQALMEELKISHLAGQQGLSLSGGERRRVEIARALATEPKFMLLDEPFAAIDPIAKADLVSVIRQLNGRGIGVLITDHDVRSTLEICSHAFIVSAGKLIAEGDAASVLANEQVRQVYLGESFRL
jgi:lipopolysaccharide export system ATP-binding protein